MNIYCSNYRVKKIVLLFIMITIFLPLTETLAQRETTFKVKLEDLLQSGMEGNAEIVQAYLEIQRTEADQRAIAGAFLPRIDVSGQYDRNIKRPVFFFPTDGIQPGGSDPTSEANIIEVGFDNAFQAIASANMPIYDKQLIENNRLAKTSIKLSHTNLEVNKNEIGSKIRKSFVSIRRTPFRGCLRF